MGVYPMWMNKRSAISVEIPVPVPGGGGGAGGGGGGGFTVSYRDKPLPKVSIKKVIVMDDYEHINITVVRVIDLSLNGGT